MRSLIFISLLLTIAISNFSKAALRFDPNDVRTWNEKDKKQFPTPLGAYFEKGSKALIFVGDHHATPESTYKVVEAGFDKYNPQIVMVESLDFSLGENPKSYLKKYISKSKEEIWKDPSLAPGAELVAISRNIPIIGGEPSIDEQMASPFLLEKGFKPKDIRNVQILQRLPYRRDKLKISDENKFFEYAKRLFNVKEPLKSFKSDFIAWYKDKSQRDFDYSKITKSESAVNCLNDDTFVQKVACEYNVNRDRFLVQHIETLLQRYDRVMVVYGTGHFVQEYPVFKKTFDQEPAYFKSSECAFSNEPEIVFSAKNELHQVWNEPDSEILLSDQAPRSQSLSKYQSEIKSKISDLNPESLLKKEYEDFTSATSPELQSEAPNMLLAMKKQAGKLRPLNCLESLLLSQQTERGLSWDRPMEFSSFVLKKSAGSQRSLRVYFSTNDRAGGKINVEVMNRIRADLKNGWKLWRHIHNHTFNTPVTDKIVLVGAPSPGLTDVDLYRQLSRDLGLESATITNGFDSLDIDNTEFHIFRTREQQ